MGIFNISLFMPYFIYFRGRFYSRTDYLSSQGGELARSFITFKKGYKLDDVGVLYLKRYTANCFGLNKWLYLDRTKWVNDNMDKIL